MGLSAALNSGLSGITSYQRSVEIVSNNIANVNNDNYSRQKSILSTKPTLQVGKHHFGQGVQLEDIQREYDVFVSNQILSESGSLGEEGVKAKPLEELERVFGMGQNTLASDIENFFNSWLDLTQNPSGEVERDYVIQQGKLLASSFDSIGNELVTVKKNINDKLISKMDEINLDLQKIANLNKQIIQHEATGTTSNSLRDKREALLEDVSKVLGAQTYESGKGSISVQLPGGLPLVQGESAMSIQYEQEGVNVSLRLDVGESTFEVNNSQFGGEFKGLLNVRDDLIPSLNEDVKKLEYNIVNQVNLQHQEGTGLDGSTGKAFFDRFTSWESGNKFSDVNVQDFDKGTLEIKVGSNTTDIIVNNSNNTLQGIIKAINDSDAAVLASVTENSGDYKLSLIPKEEGQSISVDLSALSGGSQSLGSFTKSTGADEMSVSIVNTDSIAAGHTSKPGDNTNAQLIADLADQKTIDETNTFRDFYAKMASSVGLEAQRNEMALNGLEDAMVQLKNMRDSISGVSIDEEMINLIKYQKGFEASSRMITTVDEMMDAILAMKR